MSTGFIIAALVGTLLIALTAITLIFRLLQTKSDSQIQSLKENLESLQRQLLVSQQESNKTEANQASLLRNDLSQELQKNRLELHQGLSKTTEMLEKRVASMELKVDQRMNEFSSGVQQKLEANLKEGFLHFEKVQEHLKFSGEQLQNLNTVGQSINDLNNLLKLPHMRGNFGEASLERLLSDMLPMDGFELQYRIGPNSTERVDAVIKYPKFVLPIDSKFPREQILPLFETNDPEKLEAARNQLTEVIKIQAKQIKEKYIHPEHGTTDMAILFVPSETLYFEILRDIKLCETLTRLKVFASSPNTLAICIHAISMAREYYEMAKGVEKTVSEIRKAQKHYENFERRFEDVGKHLKRSQDALSMASTHLGRYASAVHRLVGAEASEPLPPATDTNVSEPEPKDITV